MDVTLHSDHIQILSEVMDDEREINPQGQLVPVPSIIQSIETMLLLPLLNLFTFHPIAVPSSYRPTVPLLNPLYPSPLNECGHTQINSKMDLTLTITVKVKLH